MTLGGVHKVSVEAGKCSCFGLLILMKCISIRSVFFVYFWCVHLRKPLTDATLCMFKVQAEHSVFVVT